MLKHSKIFLYAAFIQALAAVLVSLYYSEILHFPPCVLCWYQRIFMYPISLILAIGIIVKDQYVYRYVFPFAIIGFLIALYHTLLQAGILTEFVTPCAIGVSCITKQVAYFGFITIPLLSLAAFGSILILLKLYKHSIK